MSASLPNGHIPVAERPNSVDIEQLIDKSGCSKEYYALEECMGEHDRKWSKCQSFVTALKHCNQTEQEKRRKNTIKPTTTTTVSLSTKQ